MDERMERLLARIDRVFDPFIGEEFTEDEAVELVQYFATIASAHVHKEKYPIRKEVTPGRAVSVSRFPDSKIKPTKVKL